MHIFEHARTPAQPLNTAIPKQSREIFVFKGKREKTNLRQYKCSTALSLECQRLFFSKKSIIKKCNNNKKREIVSINIASVGRECCLLCCSSLYRQLKSVWA